MPRSATRRIRSVADYSLEDIPPNPLIEMRAPGQKQADYAAILGVNPSVVAAAEEAMFQLIPTSYRRKIVDIKQINKEYQLHRKSKRLHNFDASSFPPEPTPTHPMQALLEHFDMNPWRFGATSCVHHIDIYKMYTVPGATQCTQNFLEFLEQIKLSDTYPTWITKFNQALRNDNPPTLAVTVDI